MIYLFHPNLLCSILKEKLQSSSVKKVDELKKRKQWNMSLDILAITMDLLETGSYVMISGLQVKALTVQGHLVLTRGEIKDEDVLTLETRVNGEVMQQSTTDMLIFPIKELIAFISTFTTLNPSDVIVTGTPGGVGMKREPQAFLKAGDTVEIEVSKIGILVNKVKPE